MPEITFTKDGSEALDIICNRWAPIMRESRRRKISQVVGWLMRDRGSEQADEALVIEGAKFVVSGGHTPFFDMMEDMDGFRAIARIPYTDDDAYFNMPRYVRRWEHFPTPPRSLREK